MKNTPFEIIRSEAEALLGELIKIRRHIHQYPELSFQEKETSAFISNQLTTLGIEHKTRVAGYGITGLLDSGKPGKTIALRADMDALPILEKTNTEYASKNTGVMHACGHDVHSTCLLGALKILNENKELWQGKVFFLFQPAEEKLPGGASLMIAEGVFNEIRPSAIFGLHVFNPLPVGSAGFRKGMYMASADELYITVKGKGGHGAVPELAIDPVPIAAQIITSLQTLVSRSAKPTIPSVLTIGKVLAEGATNVIPSEVYMEGTFRTLDEKWREEAHEIIRRICHETAASFGATCEARIEKGYPCLVNDNETTREAAEKAGILLGEDQVKELEIRMASEDFAFYSQIIPSCFLRLGTGNPEKGITANVHQDTFDIDEAALAKGAALMASMADIIMN
ncbi:MAG: M20 family metallopeptidase [Flavobacteriales bacterium]|nr:M20 family metallopeptidase [Flavobacteriales bacterium]